MSKIAELDIGSLENLMIFSLILSELVNNGNQIGTGLKSSLEGNRVVSGHELFVIVVV